MHLLVITNVYPDKYKPYAGVYISQHIHYLEQKGIDCHVVSPGDNRQGRFRTLWKYIRMSFVVARCIFKEDLDLVHSHWIFPSGLFGLIVAKLRKKPLVLTSHGAYIGNYEYRNRFLRMIILFIVKNADAVISVGTEHRGRIAQISGLPFDQIYQINMGVQLEHRPPSRRKAREELYLPGKAKIVIFIGHLYFRKGADILLRAVKRLPPSPVETIIIVAGDGPEEKALNKLVCDLGIDTVVRMIGPLRSENVMTWLAAADVCVVPSRSEPFGLVAIEAMVSNTAVIAANVGGLSENIRNGENGLLFPVGDDEELSRRLDTILNDEGLRSQIANNGLLESKEYDMLSQVDKVIAIYSSLVH